MSSSNTLLDNPYFIASYRTAINPRLFQNPFPNTTHLLTSNDVFPQQFWHTGSIMVTENFNKRCNNVTYCRSAVVFAHLELDSVYSNMYYEQRSAIFNATVTKKWNELNRYIGEMNAETVMAIPDGDNSALMSAESRITKIIKVLLELLYSLKNITKVIVVDNIHLEKLIYTFYVSTQELELSVQRFASLSTEIRKITSDRIAEISKKSVEFTARHSVFTDDLSSELGFFKSNLDAILLWLDKISIRFTKLPEVQQNLVNNDVLEAQAMYTQIKSGTASKKIKEFVKSYNTPAWLTEASNGSFNNLNWFILFTNYLLNFAIDIIYHGMVIFREFSVSCSVGLVSSSNWVIYWGTSQDRVIDTRTGNPLEAVKHIKQYYKLIVRACYIISTAWHFDKIESETSDSVWESQSRKVFEKYEDSLNNTNVTEMRGRINYRIKRSNIREAGLGIFFDEDVYDITEPDIKGRFDKGKWGLPLLIYDGKIFSQEDAKVLYGGSDPLRPYSVETTDGGPELDAFHGNNSDVARFINDPFNRLPEYGLSPDTKNQDPLKRTFTYNTYFLWCAVPKSHVQKKGKTPFEHNDKTIQYLRTANENKLETGYKQLTSDSQFTFVLGVFATPLDKIPSADPKLLFAKGEELWIQYGYNYIKKISSASVHRNVDFTYQELGSFIFSRRSTIDISIQEDIREMLNEKTSDSDGGNLETAKATFERTIVTCNVLSTRPFNTVDSYYSYALDQISKCFIEELTVEQLKWCQSVSDRDLKQPADYISILLKNNIFDRAKVRKSLNVLSKDIPMESVIAILTTLCTFYYASIIHLIDSSVAISKETRENYDIECLQYIKTISDETQVRLSGLEQIKANMGKTIDLLKETCIAWYVRHEVEFDDVKWKKLIKYFRIDLDTCIKKLKLSGLSFETFQKTKEYIDRSSVGAEGIRKVKYIVNVLYRALNVDNAQSYIEDVAWIPEGHKEDEEITELLENMFSHETQTFKNSSRNRMNGVMSAMKRSVKLKNLIVNFTDNDLKPDVIVKSEVANIMATVTAYIHYNEVEDKIEKFPFKTYNDPDAIIKAIQETNVDIFFPKWVYETNSNITGKKPFLAEFDRIMRGRQGLESSYEPESQMELGYEVSKSRALLSIPETVRAEITREVLPEHQMIDLDLTFDIDLSLGHRFEGDEYPRQGYVAEVFASREFGPNLDIVRVPLEIERDRVKKNQRISISIPLIQEERHMVPIGGQGKFFPESVVAKYATVGIYIKGKVKPFASPTPTKKLRLDYDGECYIQLGSPNLEGVTIPILTKTFELERDYQTIGSVKVNSVNFKRDIKFVGTFTQSDVESIEKASSKIIDDFYDTINSFDLTYHPQESFLRNKHTPIWPNTPFGRIPSSLFVLNVPQGMFAWNGAMTFYKSLEALCYAYNIDMEVDLKKSLSNITIRPSDYKPTNNDVLELYAVLRLIGEAMALVPDLCDYKPDFTRGGDIGENYGEGNDGLDDCESLAKLGYSIGYSVVQLEHEEGSIMYHVKEILLSYVFGMVGCSSSRAAASKTLGEEENIKPEFRGKVHINHIPAALIPVTFFYDMCKRSKKFDDKKMEVYAKNRIRGKWYDPYLQPLVIEGTGNTVPLMVTCEKQIDDPDVRDKYSKWACDFLEAHYTIFSKFPRLSQLGFQDITPLKFVSTPIKSKSLFSSFYTKFVHFWTGDLAENGGQLVTDFMFCYPKSSSTGAQSNWVYGIDFYDFIHQESSVALYPVVSFKRDQYETFSSIAKKQVYPAYIHPVTLNCSPTVFSDIQRKGSYRPRISVLQEHTENPVLGILSQRQIVAYTNHIELYSDIEDDIVKLVENGEAGIISCKVRRCEMSDITDMIQLTFTLGE